MDKPRFSKQALINTLQERAANTAEHYGIDMGIGYGQLLKGADINSPDWWNKVEAYFRAYEYSELARDIEWGTAINKTAQEQS